MTLLALTDVTKRIPDGAKEIVVLDRVSVDIERGDVVGIYGERRAGEEHAAEDHGGHRVARCRDRQLRGQRRGQGCRWTRGRGCGAMRGSRWFVATGVRCSVISRCSNTSRCRSRPKGMTLAEAEGIARPVLDRVGGLAWEHLTTDRLSLDERIRVELAQAMVREPRLLLVDEPAVLIDAGAGRELYALLRSLAKKSRMALVIASEDTTPLVGVDRAMTISDGQLRTTDSRRRVVAFPDRRSRGSSSRAS